MSSVKSLEWINYDLEEYSHWVNMKSIFLTNQSVF